MKKKILLFALVAIMAFSAISVSASSLRNFYPVEDSYSFTYNVGAANATAQYGMIVVKGTGNDVDMNEILYIGQAAADENGNIRFENFAPMGEAPSDYEEGAEGDNGDGVYFEECTVFIGGKGISDGEGDAAKAQAIGVLKNGSGVPVMGKVVDTFSSRTAIVKVMDGTDELVSTKTEADGTFSLVIGGGENLTVTVAKDAYLTFTYTGVDVTGAVDLGEIDITGCAGDVDGNKVIELDDLRAVLADYNKTENLENDNADVDDNGVVELDDLRAVLANYNETQESKTQAY